jgi:hypothetical protein
MSTGELVMKQATLQTIVRENNKNKVQSYDTYV